MALTFAFRGPGDWDSDTKGFEDDESENLKALGMHLAGEKTVDEDDEDEEEEIIAEVKKIEGAEAPVVAVVEEEDDEEELDELEELERLAKRLKEEEGSVGLEEGEE